MLVSRTIFVYFTLFEAEAHHAIARIVMASAAGTTCRGLSDVSACQAIATFEDHECCDLFVLTITSPGRSAMDNGRTPEG